MQNAHKQLGQIFFSLVLLGFTFSLGCAGDVGMVDRVQPAYMSKTDFLNNSWYYRRTVVDAPETMGAYVTVGTGDLFTMERIRWDIQEDFLLAYRDYEWAPGSEGAEEEGADYYGTPIAIFPITKHFDIIEEYNPSTGEKTNVRSENSKDRPWFAREFMRIDWSTNKIPNIDFILPVEFLELDNDAGGDYYVHEDEATSPFRARIEPQNGYIDFVVAHFVVPDLWTCWLTYQMWFSYCGDGEIMVRHAFMKVDQEDYDSYQPLHYPDSVVLKENGQEIYDPETNEVKREPVFERFGYYRLDKLTYDRERELTESGRLYRIMRFDIWDKSIDEAGEEIPYAKRTPKPIIYYLNWDFPKELVDDAKTKVGGGWNDVFLSTVASLQNKSKDQYQAPMFEIKENPCNVENLQTYLAANSDVTEKVILAMTGAKGSNASTYLSEMSNDEEKRLTQLCNWCAATEYYSRDLPNRFTWPQAGDPRYNMLNWIQNVTPAGWAGYGPMLADPISGEIIVSTANLMGWTINQGSKRIMEYVDYANGELSVDDVLSGSYKPDGFTHPSYGLAAKRQPSLEVAHLNAQSLASPEHLQSLAARFQQLGTTEKELLVPIENSKHFQERINRIKGTAIEYEHMIHPADLMLASNGLWDPDTPISTDLLDDASNIKRRHDINERSFERDRFFMERLFTPAAVFDDALVGFAKTLKNLSPEERYDKIRRYLFEAIALHEIGHNLGLRHNFAASYDAMNYPSKFWELELDPANDTEQKKLDARQPEYKYSSIMDYHGKVNGDFHGVAPYDYAAIKFGYGQIVETFSQNLGVGNREQILDWRQWNDYKKIPNHFTSWQSLHDRTDTIWDWNNTPTPPTNEVAYMFCGDEYAGRTPFCKVFDFGANQREVIQAHITSYKNYFIFRNFSRGQLTLNTRRIFGTTYRIFRDIHMTYQYMYLFQSQNPTFLTNTDLGADIATAVTAGFNLYGEIIGMPVTGSYFRCDTPNGLIYLEYMDLLYTPFWIDYQIQAWTCDQLIIEEEMGVRKLKVDYENLFPMPLDPEVSLPFFLDYSWEIDYEFTRLQWLGTFWDKQDALIWLTYPFANFPLNAPGVHFFEDRTTYSVSPYRIYAQPILELFRDILSQNLGGYGKYFDEDTQTFVKRPFLDPNKPLSLSVDGAVSYDTDTDLGFPVVYPPRTRLLRDLIAIYGTAFLSSPLDPVLDFSKHLGVALKGSFDDFDVTNVDPADIAECTIPGSGQTYRAIKVDDGFNLAYDMVANCIQLVEDFENYGSYMDRDNIFESALEENHQFLNLFRLVRVYYEFGVEI